MDLNWGVGPEDDDPPPDNPDQDDPSQPPDCQQPGFSTVACQSQAIGEEVPIAGTDLSLRYRSDLQVGRTDRRSFTFSISGPTVSPSLQRIDVVISVAGRRYASSFPPSPGQSTAFTWDGTDGYGRKLQGGATVRVWCATCTGPSTSRHAPADPPLASPASTATRCRATGPGPRSTSSGASRAR